MKKLVEAHKFTAWYDAVEDRLRLVANMDKPEARVDFWITRRLFLTIITQLDDFIEPKGMGIERDDIDKLITKGSPSTDSSESDSEQKVDGDSADRGEEDNRVSLLRTLNISWDKKSKRVSLSLISDDYEVEANLDAVAMTAFMRMLVMQAPSVEWGISSMMFRR